MGFERFGDLGMELPAHIAQQAVMGGVLDQRMLEAIEGIGRRTALDDQLGGDEAI